MTALQTKKQQRQLRTSTPPVFGDSSVSSIDIFPVVKGRAPRRARSLSPVRTCDRDNKNTKERDSNPYPIECWLCWSTIGYYPVGRDPVKFDGCARCDLCEKCCNNGIHGGFCWECHRKMPFEQRCNRPSCSQHAGLLDDGCGRCKDCCKPPPPSPVKRSNAASTSELSQYVSYPSVFCTTSVFLPPILPPAPKPVPMATHCKDCKAELRFITTPDPIGLLGTHCLLCQRCISCCKTTHNKTCWRCGKAGGPFCSSTSCPEQFLTCGALAKSGCQCCAKCCSDLALLMTFMSWQDGNKFSGSLSQHVNIGMNRFGHQGY